MTSCRSKSFACAALLVVLGAMGCRGAASGVACGTASATPIAPDPAAAASQPAHAPAPRSAPDPTAPVLVPGENRPSLRSAELGELEGMADAAPFAPPSRERPHGSLLVAMSSGSDTGARMIEVDLASLKPVRERRLPTGGTRIQVAASEAGAVVVLHDLSGARPEDRPHDTVLVLSPSLEIEKTMQVDGHGTSVAVDGAHAVYATTERTGTNQLVAFDVPGGDVVARRTVNGELADEWVPTAQIVTKHERVWLLKRGRKHYELDAFSNDLAKLEGRVTMPGSDQLTEGYDVVAAPHYGDGLLVPAKDGVIVVRSETMTRYDAELRGGLPLVLPDAPMKPAVDDATGRLLLPSGNAAESYGAKELLPLVVFRNGIWRWSSDGEVPLRYDAPVAAFFVGGRGVIVTRNPGLRVSVLDFGAVPPPAPDLVAP